MQTGTKFKSMNATQCYEAYRQHKLLLSMPGLVAVCSLLWITVNPTVTQSVWIRFVLVLFIGGSLVLAENMSWIRLQDILKVDGDAEKYLQVMQFADNLDPRGLKKQKILLESARALIAMERYEEAGKKLSKINITKEKNKSIRAAYEELSAACK